MTARNLQAPFRRGWPRADPSPREEMRVRALSGRTASVGASAGREATGRGCMALQHALSSNRAHAGARRERGIIVTKSTRSVGSDGLGASGARTAGGKLPRGKASGGEDDTELVFRLERRGEGWGEEIFPTLVVERRRLNGAQPNTNSRDESDVDIDASEQSACSGHKRRGTHTAGVSKYSELENALLRLGLTGEQVNDAIALAVAWRVTAGGLILVDRRRRAKALKNLAPLVQFMEALGVEKGRGVGDIIASTPLLMLCNVNGNENWDRRMVELAVFFRQHGHCTVPADYEPCPELPKWTHRLRKQKALGKLTGDQMKLLESVRFDFGLGITSRWESMFDRLLDFILENGHSQVPPGGRHSRDLSLHEWTELQRIAYAAGKLSGEHKARLDSVNFEWQAKYVSEWLKYYQFYKGVKTMKAGSAKYVMPGSHFWVLKQRVLWYNKDHIAERLHLLKEIGFDFDPYKSSFDEMCKGIQVLLDTYKVDSILALIVRLYDELMLPQTGEGKPDLEAVHIRQIWRWIKAQHVMKRENMLTQEEMRRLQGLGFMWEGLEWQLNLEALLKFRAIKGNCEVPRSHRLNSWVVNMRVNRQDLPVIYKSLLDMVGFTWEKKGAWSRMFEQLSIYHTEHGHVDIPQHNHDYRHLGAWLINQRTMWRKGTLPVQHIQRLEAMGVTK